MPPLEIICWGTKEELCRPCVDCGLWTGRFCDGADGTLGPPCLAADRVPSEVWCVGQLTPLCSRCDWNADCCHFCRNISLCTPPVWGPHGTDPAAYRVEADRPIVPGTPAACQHRVRLCQAARFGHTNSCSINNCVAHLTAAIHILLQSLIRAIHSHTGLSTHHPSCFSGDSHPAVRNK